MVCDADARIFVDFEHFISWANSVLIKVAGKAVGVEVGVEEGVEAEVEEATVEDKRTAVKVTLFVPYFHQTPASVSIS